jgi:hypothetical protein
MCFGLGRPMSIPAHEIAIPDPKEQPMLLALVELSRIMTKSARSIYGQRYESLLPLWKSAKDVRKDLHSFARRVHGVLNFGLEASPRPGEVGVCQTVLMLCMFDSLSLSFGTNFNSIPYRDTTHVSPFPHLSGTVAARRTREELRDANDAFMAR